ncbi:MAG: protein-methionine-sulfoxide reductase catalytic subunit MsrP [Rhodospirillales bacterium]|nr:protein-methionine-sulfoxide reductase catalytic subunit MsrP [Rhodospirillales bacterium]
MHVIKRFGWEIPAARITPEPVVLRRRAILAGSAAVGTVALGTFRSLPARAEEAPARNPAFDPGRAITEEKYVLKQRPWTIEIGGMVSQPRTIAIDDLLKQVQLEERVYRHRCVEAWAMTVPWTGFQLSQLVKLADPLGSAKYVVFETAQDKTMTGLNAPFYPWPYIEGVTMDEAANELAFISTGMYGKPLPPQNGGPLRLTLPWKYGFKSAKAIAKVTFTDKRPTTFWEAIQPSEYGFWANVNPAVPHPRWSQAKERLLGDDEMVPTQLYNGYASFVSGLYTDRKGEKLFM